MFQTENGKEATLPTEEISAVKGTLPLSLGRQESRQGETAAHQQVAELDSTALSMVPALKTWKIQDLRVTVSS